MSIALPIDPPQQQLLTPDTRQKSQNSGRAFEREFERNTSPKRDNNRPNDDSANASVEGAKRSKEPQEANNDQAARESRENTGSETSEVEQTLASDETTLVGPLEVENPNIEALQTDGSTVVDDATVSLAPDAQIMDTNALEEGVQLVSAHGTDELALADTPLLTEEIVGDETTPPNEENVVPLISAAVPIQNTKFDGKAATETNPVNVSNAPAATKETGDFLSDTNLATQAVPEQSQEFLDNAEAFESSLALAEPTEDGNQELTKQLKTVDTNTTFEIPNPADNAQSTLDFDFANRELTTNQSLPPSTSFDASSVSGVRTAALAQAAAGQVAVAIQRNTNKNEVSIQLDPPELGTLQIRMQFTEQGSVNAVLAIDNDSTRTLMRANESELRAALSNAGFENAQFQFTDGQGRSDGSSEGGKREGLLVNGDLDVAALGAAAGQGDPRTRIKTDTAVDIRV